MAIVNDDGIHEDEFMAAVHTLPPELKRVYITARADPKGSEEPADALKTDGVVYPTPDYLNPPEREPVVPVERPEAKILYKTSSPLVNITDHDIEDATNVAMAAGPGTLMGVKSAIFNRVNLAKAQELEAAAAHPDEIWKEAQTFRGADGRWRQEIPDNAAPLKAHNLDVTTQVVDNPSGWSHVEKHGTVLQTVGVPDSRKGFVNTDPKTPEEYAAFWKSVSNHKAKTTTVGDILDHPELFKAYPHLADIKVRNLNEYAGIDKEAFRNVEGIHSSDGIYMKTSTPTQFRATLLHELQHAVQRHEGFATGGNSGMFTPKGLEEAAKNFETVKANTLEDLGKVYSKEEINTLQFFANQEAAGKEVRKEVVDHWKPLIDIAKDNGDYHKLLNNAKSSKLLKEQSDKQFDMYSRLMGEVESRNVEKRMDMIRLERKYQSPPSTEDKPRYLQINPK